MVKDSLSPHQEIARRHLVRVVVLIYWLIIFEGALRKWFLPMLAQPLFFIKDPLVLYCYWHAARTGLLPSTRTFKVVVGVILLFIPLSLVQTVIGIESLPAAVYGLRMYFLVAPLALIIGETFRGPDLFRICKHTLIIGIGMAILVFIQYRSPLGSPINKLLETENVFVYGDLPRASGTFSFTAGHLYFSSVLISMVLASWLLPPQRRPLAGWYFIFASLMALINVMLDGNRSMFSYLVYLFLASTLHKLVSPDKTFRWQSFRPEMFLAFGVAIYITCFSSAYDNMVLRFERAGEAEGGLPILRMLGDFDLLAPVSRLSSPLGQGLGNGIPAAQRFPGRLTVPIEAESELPRIILESGYLGVAWILVRIFLALNVVKASISCSRAGGLPLALLLVPFPAQLVLHGQISFNGAAQYFGWVLLGLTLAASKVGIKEKGNS